MLRLGKEMIANPSVPYQMLSMYLFADSPVDVHWDTMIALTQMLLTIWQPCGCTAANAHCVSSSTLVSVRLSKWEQRLCLPLHPNWPEWHCLNEDTQNTCSSPCRQTQPSHGCTLLCTCEWGRTLWTRFQDRSAGDNLVSALLFLHCPICRQVFKPSYIVQLLWRWETLLGCMAGMCATNWTELQIFWKVRQLTYVSGTGARPILAKVC